MVLTGFLLRWTRLVAGASTDPGGLPSAPSRRVGPWNPAIARAAGPDRGAPALEHAVVDGKIIDGALRCAKCKAPLSTPAARWTRPRRASAGIASGCVDP
jgi:hypothetical protein